jgi:rhodanese-related sulfurtransferase
MTTQISRTDLQALMASGAVTLIDALPVTYYDQQHLPGAINLVETDVVALAPTLLTDTSATVVTYCSNAACGNSKAVANRLEKLGYSDVRTYRDGIQDWVGAGMATEATSATTDVQART